MIGAVIRTPLVVNMINIIGNIGSTLSDPQELAKTIAQETKKLDNPIIGVRYADKVEVGCPPRKTKKIANSGKYFYNCIEVFFYLQGQLKKPKLFETGIVHIPGCKSISDGRLIIQKLIEILKVIPNIAQFLVNSPENLKATLDMDKKVYTTQFEIECSQIVQLKLAQILRDKYNMTVIYEPNNYPGVLIYHYPVPNGSKNTIIIQRSGKATINGAKHIKSVLQSYNFIISVFTQYPELRV